MHYINKYLNFKNGSIANNVIIVGLLFLESVSIK